LGSERGRFSMRSKASIALTLALSLAAGAASAEEFTQAKLTGVMNSVFGAGKWRLTGGYRSPEREDELRAQGAMTVRPGGLSAHSLGRPGASGAYDVVVNGMDPWEAAARLRAAGAPFARFMPKGAHGSQGPHLHLEPGGGGFGLRRGGGPMGSPWMVAQRTPAQQAMAELNAQAGEGDADAQLQLSRAYAVGLASAPDAIAAYVWAARAAGNPQASPETQAGAVVAQTQLAQNMKTADIAYARRFSDGSVQARDGEPIRVLSGGASVILASNAR